MMDESTMKDKLIRAGAVNGDYTLIDNMYCTLINDTVCRCHHTAAAKGYVSRKLRHTEPKEYKGKFGEGYVTYSPRYDTTQYTYITYWIKV